VEASATIDLSSPSVDSPQAATAALAEMSAALQPAPSLVPQNAREADLRLTHLLNDVEWARKLMAGDVQVRREFELLSELKTNGADALTDPAPQVMETTVGAEGLRRSDVLGIAADLRALWNDSDNCEAAIQEALTAESVDADLLQNMQEWKVQALSDPVFVEMLMRSDRWATQRMTLCNLIIGIGTLA
jgi:hypothetical protein